jgi:hypothetical protein
VLALVGLAHAHGDGEAGGGAQRVHALRHVEAQVLVLYAQAEIGFLDAGGAHHAEAEGGPVHQPVLAAEAPVHVGGLGLEDVEAEQQVALEEAEGLAELRSGRLSRSPEAIEKFCTPMAAR